MDDRDQIAAAYESVVKGRRSIRGYLPKPVPRALIEEVITMATYTSPSLTDAYIRLTLPTNREG